jgi:hypothetical protein
MSSAPGRIILPDTWNDETLCVVRKDLGARIEDLVALKEDNDPYLAGREERREKAE